MKTQGVLAVSRSYSEVLGYNQYPLQTPCVPGAKSVLRVHYIRSSRNLTGVDHVHVGCRVAVSGGCPLRWLPLHIFKEILDLAVPITPCKVVLR